MATTRMDDPLRAERLWMALAIATGWLLSVGGEAEAQAQAQAQADKPLDIKEPSVPGAVRRRGKRWRMVGIFQHGWSLIIAALLNDSAPPCQTRSTGSMAQATRKAMRHPWLLAW